MSSTYDLTAILDLPLSAALGFIMHAIDCEKEKLAWDMWSSLYPYMVLKRLEFRAFSDFKDDLLKKPVACSQKTAEEIENEIIGVIAAHERR